MTAAVLSSIITGVASVVIAYSVAKSFVLLATGSPIRVARMCTARGALHGLSFLVAVALLNTLRIVDWRSLGLFAVVLGLRTMVKAVLTWEERQLSNQHS